MRSLSVILAFFMLAIPVTPAVAASAEKAKTRENMRKAHDFLKNCGYYFLATMDGDQPRVRPFGTAVIFDGKLYIQTGKKKDVSKQLAKNPKIEICAYDGSGKWLRIEALAVSDDNIEAKRFMLDSYPELKGMYSAEDDNTQVLYLKNAKATFYSFDGAPEVTEF